MIIAPSLLAADFANLQRDIELINKSEADWFHVDIMDGSFVPNISFGMPVLEAINKFATKPLDVHLMIVNPDKYLEIFKTLGAAHITVHLEACTHLHRVIEQIKRIGCKAGVALNPHTPVESISEVIDMLDIVLLMSVNPGFGGQTFIKNTYGKIQRLKDLILTKNSECLIEIDGGVNLENAPLLKEKGADILVAGNFVFNSADPVQMVKTIKSV